MKSMRRCTPPFVAVLLLALGISSCEVSDAGEAAADVFTSTKNHLFSFISDSGVSDAGDFPISEYLKANDGEWVMKGGITEIVIFPAQETGNPTTYHMETEPQHGTYTWYRNHLEYTKEPGYFGIDTFTYYISDGTFRSKSATFTLYIPKNIHYVDVNANPANYPSGSSWRNAFRYVQSASDAAVSGDCVLVAPGTYTAYIPPNADTETARQPVLTMKQGVYYFGGVSPTDGFIKRDPKTQQSILNGQGVSYHVVTEAVNALGADNARLDGFVITGGRADGTVYRNRCGGGLYAAYAERITIAHCTFTGNYAVGNAGAGYYAGEGGGAAYIDTRFAEIVDCDFSGNNSHENGGALNISATMHIANCSFTNNSTRIDGGALYSSNGKGTIENCTFDKNSTEYNEYYGGACCLHQAYLHFVNTTFSNNSAYDGGAIYQKFSGALSFKDCKLIGNSAGGNGGAVNGNAFYFTNSVLAGNSAKNGSAVYLGGYVTMYSCTVYGNTGYPFYTSWDGAGITVYNSIVWGNGGFIGGKVTAGYPKIRFENCCLQDNVQQYRYLGDYNFSNDPLLNESYRLRPGSPCIEKGSVMQLLSPRITTSETPENDPLVYDALGRDRMYDGNYNGSRLPDIGAYEFVGRYIVDSPFAIPVYYNDCDSQEKIGTPLIGAQFGTELTSASKGGSYSLGVTPMAYNNGYYVTTASRKYKDYCTATIKPFTIGKPDLSRGTVSFVTSVSGARNSYKANTYINSWSYFYLTPDTYVCNYSHTSHDCVTSFYVDGQSVGSAVSNTRGSMVKIALQWDLVNGLSDGNTIAVYCNGKKIASVKSSMTPAMIQEFAQYFQMLSKNVGDGTHGAGGAIAGFDNITFYDSVVDPITIYNMMY